MTNNTNTAKNYGIRTRQIVAIGMILCFFTIIQSAEGAPVLRFIEMSFGISRFVLAITSLVGGILILGYNFSGNVYRILTTPLLFYIVSGSMYTFKTQLDSPEMAQTNLTSIILYWLLYALVLRMA